MGCPIKKFAVGLFFPKNQRIKKTDRTSQDNFRSTWGTPKNKKPGLLREDIFSSSGALGNQKALKTATGEEKTSSVYIR